MHITIKMKKDIAKIIELPEGFQAEVKADEVSIKANGKENKKRFDLKGAKISKEGNTIKITFKKATKKESKLIGTAAAHIRNMINGLKEDWAYQLEICNVHFPVTVKVEGNKLNIKNFLGEIIDRQAVILPNVKVEVKGNTITVSSPDRDAAGQTAANIEKSTKIRLRDRRIFQDGIFITEKAGAKK